MASGPLCVCLCIALNSKVEVRPTLTLRRTHEPFGLPKLIGSTELIQSSGPKFEHLLLTPRVGLLRPTSPTQRRLVESSRGELVVRRLHRTPSQNTLTLHLEDELIPTPLSPRSPQVLGARRSPCPLKTTLRAPARGSRRGPSSAPTSAAPMPNCLRRTGPTTSSSSVSSCTPRVLAVTSGAVLRPA